MVGGPSLTQLLATGVCIELELAHVVLLLLTTPGSSEPLLHQLVLLLPLVLLRLAHAYQPVTGHLSQGTVLPQSTRLQRREGEGEGMNSGRACDLSQVV